MTLLNEIFPVRFGGYWGVAPGEGDVDALAIRNGDVGTAGSIDWSKLPTRAFTAREVTKALVRAGDILLTTSGSCGNVAFITSEPKMPTLATNFVRVLRVDPKRTDAKFAFHYLRTQRFRDQIAPFVRGATIKNLSVESAFAAAHMPVPPLEEQRRIAAILDEADALRAKRRQALAHLDDLTQSIFLDMFGTALATRERVPLKTLTEVITKGTTPTSVGLKFTDAGVPFLRVQNLVRGTVRFGTGDLFINAGAHQTLARSHVHPGDLLVSIAGTIGRCAVVPDDSPEMNCNQAVALVRLIDRAVAPWVMAWLSTGDAKAQMGAASVTATISNLSLGQLGALQVPTVSRAEVDLFRDRLAAVHRANEIAAANSASLEALFQSLQARAFRGDL